MCLNKCCFKHSSMSRRKQANPAKLDSICDMPSTSQGVIVNETANDNDYEMPEVNMQSSTCGNESGQSDSPPPAAGSDVEESSSSLAAITPEQNSWNSSPYVSQPSTPSDNNDDYEFTYGVTDSTPYGCRYCVKAFSRSCILTRHEQTHTEQLQFTCSYCPRLFKHKRSRDRHTKLHTGDKKYKCQHCESAFSRSDHLKIHMKTHDSRKPYKCGTCNRGYNTAAALASHQQSHLKQEVRSGSHTSGGSTPSPGVFRCLQCPETFSKPELLQNHLVVTHRETITPQPNAALRMEKLRVACMYCAKDFASLEALCKHASTAHNDVANGNAHNLAVQSPCARESPIPEIYQNGTPTYACERCTMRFDSPQTLKDHLDNVHWRPLLLSNPLNYGLQSPQNSQHFRPEKGFSPLQLQPTDLSRKARKDDSFEGRHAKKRKSDSTTKQMSPSNVSPYDSNDRPCICSFCYAQMPNFKSFLIHMESHVSVNQPNASVVNNSLLGYCPICGEPGRDQNDFNNHIITHAITNVSGRCCHPCKKSFEKLEELQKHFTDFHAHTVYKCSLCNEIFDSKLEMQLHFTSKHNHECNHYKCCLCSDQIFHDRLAAELHISMQHLHQLPSVPRPNPTPTLVCAQYQTDLDPRLLRGDYSPIFQCSFCHKSFKDEYSQYYHILKEHNESRGEGEHFHMDTVSSQRQNPSISPNYVFSKTSPNEKSSKLDAKECIGCDMCSRNDFLSESELQTHKKLHHSKSKIGPVSLQCAYCNEYSKSRSDLENHMKTHQVSSGKGKHKCNICDEIFSSPLILADHKLTHCKIVAGNTCTQCKSVLSDEESFYTHHFQHCNGPIKASSINLPVNCIICCQTLQTDIELRLHGKFHLKHLVQKDFLCGVCNKLFNSPSGMVKHTAGQNSDSVTVYVCKECRSTEANGNCNFGNVSENDVKVGVGSGTMKQFACIQCPQTFDSEEEVQNHATMHMITEGANLECRLCKQMFASPYKLQTHLIEHNFYGMNQYSCYVCSSVFTAASGLQGHIIGHGLNSRPYECGQCQMKFFFRAELDNHRFTHLLASTQKDAAPTSFSDISSVNGDSAVYKSELQQNCKICKYCSGSYLDNGYFVEHYTRCPYYKKNEDSLENGDNKTSEVTKEEPSDDAKAEEKLNK